MLVWILAHEPSSCAVSISRMSHSASLFPLVEDGPGAYAPGPCTPYRPCTPRTLRVHTPYTPRVHPVGTPCTAPPLRRHPGFPRSLDPWLPEKPRSLRAALKEPVLTVLLKRAEKSRKEQKRTIMSEAGRQGPEDPGFEVGQRRRPGASWPRAYDALRRARPGPGPVVHAR